MRHCNKPATTPDVSLDEVARNAPLRLGTDAPFQPIRRVSQPPGTEVDMNDGTVRFVREDGQQVGPPQSEPVRHLSPGLRVLVPNGEARTEFEVVRWHYLLDSAIPTLVGTVRPTKEPWFSRLSQDNQVLLVYMLIALTVVPTAILGSMYYFSRDELLACIGWYGRNVVGWCLLIVGALIPLKIKGWGSGPQTLLGTYLGLLCPLLGLVAAIAWVEISRPLQPLVARPADYAAYASQLFLKLDTSVPFAVSALPWIALLVKLAGFEFFGKVFEQLAKGK